MRTCPTPTPCWTQSCTDHFILWDKPVFQTLQPWNKKNSSKVSTFPQVIRTLRRNIFLVPDRSTDSSNGMISNPFTQFVTLWLYGKRKSLCKIHPRMTDSSLKLTNTQHAFRSWAVTFDLWGLPFLLIIFQMFLAPWLESTCGKLNLPDMIWTQPNQTDKVSLPGIAKGYISAPPSKKKGGGEHLEHFLTSVYALFDSKVRKLSVRP